MNRSKKWILPIVAASFFLLGAPTIYANTTGGEGTLIAKLSKAEKANQKAAKKAKKEAKKREAAEKKAAKKAAKKKQKAKKSKKAKKRKQTQSTSYTGKGQRWEYKAFKLKPPRKGKWIEKWNNLGNSGWEFVTYFENVYIFKRPK